ncbi:MAG: hypothetical protein L6R39_005792 [Caloplaca ligustica]|nr:MAG: hypothetical protein L6R39_005792 [Caloplaca ligustica]
MRALSLGPVQSTYLWAFNPAGVETQLEHLVALPVARDATTGWPASRTDRGPGPPTNRLLPAMLVIRPLASPLRPHNAAAFSRASMMYIHIELDAGSRLNPRYLAN